MRTGGCRAHSRRSSPQVRGAGSGTEAQLRVSWDGVLNAERTGRWWIVGSAWTGAPMIDSSRQKVPQKPLANLGVWVLGNRSMPGGPWAPGLIYVLMSSCRSLAHQLQTSQG